MHYEGLKIYLRSIKSKADCSRLRNQIERLNPLFWDVRQLLYPFRKGKLDTVKNYLHLLFMDKFGHTTKD